MPISFAAAGRIVLLLACALAAARPAEAEGAGRIVAAGGVIAETLYALDLSERIVGVDTTSLYPPQALKEKPNVGYVRALSAEGILSLQPTLMIAIAGAGPAPVLTQIEQAGVRIEHLPDAFTPPTIVERIRRIGALAGADAAAAVLAGKVGAQFESLRAEEAARPMRQRVLFLLSLQNGKAMAAGRGTSAEAMLELSGLTNAAAGFDGYKPMTDEAIAAAAPDVVVLMGRGETPPPASEVFAQAGLALTPAAQRKALVVMDGLYLLGFGPRTPEAAQALRRAVAEAAP